MIKSYRDSFPPQPSAVAFPDVTPFGALRSASNRKIENERKRETEKDDEKERTTVTPWAWRRNLRALASGSIIGHSWIQESSWKLKVGNSRVVQYAMTFVVFLWAKSSCASAQSIAEKLGCA